MKLLYPLLSAKLCIPPPRPVLVSRPQLIERLNAGVHGKLTLVSAPAGFGKTTLVGEWLRDVKQRVTWLSGVILPGLSLTRYFYKIKMSGFTTILGILALISGFAQIFGLVAYEWIFLLILLAVYLILRPWLNKMQIFGKAEES